MEENDQIFNKIQEGNKHYFEILFKQYYAPLCVYSRRYVADTDECEEIVQAFFLKLWEKREAIEINSSLKNYLFSSIRNRCLNYIKHQKIRKNYSDEILSNSDNEMDVSEFCIEVDLQHKIENSIATLPPRRKEIFLLSRKDGLKYREIADQLGISIKTVETQMGTALKDLRKQLREYFD